MENSSRVRLSDEALGRKRNATRATFRKPNVTRRSSEGQIVPARCLAFTLTELLVVLAVVGLLAGLLAITVSKARRKTKEAVCLNNLKQIYTAFQLYEGDNDDRFPLGVVSRDAPGAAPQPGANAASLWLFNVAVGGKKGRNSQAPPAQLRPLHRYLSVAEAFRCAADAGFDLRPSGGPLVAPSRFEDTGCSYAYNARDAAQGMSLGGKRIDWIHVPTKYVLMYEPPAVPFFPASSEKSICVYWHKARKPGSCPGDCDDERGPRVSPILFVDGHAQIINFSGDYSGEPSSQGCIWSQRSR